MRTFGEIRFENKIDFIIYLLYFIHFNYQFFNITMFSIAFVVIVSSLNTSCYRSFSIGTLFSNLLNKSLKFGDNCYPLIININNLYNK